MKDSHEPVGKNPLEWTVFAISSALVIALIAALVVFGLQEKDGPPVLDLRLETPTQRDGRVVVPLVITNRGHAVAVDVEVVVRGRTGKGHAEGRVAFDFIPRGATRRGTISFAGPDAPDAWVAEVAGFREP